MKQPLPTTEIVIAFRSTFPDNGNWIDDNGLDINWPSDWVAEIPMEESSLTRAIQITKGEKHSVIKEYQITAYFKDGKFTGAIAPESHKIPTDYEKKTE